MTRTGMTMGSSTVIFAIAGALGLGVLRPETMSGLMGVYAVTMTLTIVVATAVWKLFRHYDL